MIQHIALFKFEKFDTPQEKETYYNRLKEVFNGLENRVPAIKSLEIGFDELEDKSSYDFVVNVVIENMASLPDYANHPEHVKAVLIIKEKVLDRKAIDYSI